MDRLSFLYSDVYSDKRSGFILLRLLCYILIKTAVTTLSQRAFMVLVSDMITALIKTLKALSSMIGVLSSSVPK